ncbi:hypothetical protein [Phytoactinopolyspora halotolerans]|uniref:Uncharacterized protein n=1 Tax=Phytoactinopolyspora halotolerans TaxID=1981512 RepID=A0A6L9S7P1_9ACTN|nr:hypothetical protein [Phytoactinopolyspora halotolerans]NEE01186.1 hypothetical protein [Phytoactinopolyspora halotolerans]
MGETSFYTTFAARVFCTGRNPDSRARQRFKDRDRDRCNQEHDLSLRRRAIASICRTALEQIATGLTLRNQLGNVILDGSAVKDCGMQVNDKLVR